MARTYLIFQNCNKWEIIEQIEAAGTKHLENDIDIVTLTNSEVEWKTHQTIALNEMEIE